MSNLNRNDIQEAIPPGPYCYFGSRNPADKSYKPCPYWKWVSKRKARCAYLDIEDDVEDEHGYEPLALWDQLKECGINDGDELYE